MVIIIPTCQRGELLERTLQCLVDADLPELLRRVLVVENGKKDEAAAADEDGEERAVRLIY